MCSSQKGSNQPRLERRALEIHGQLALGRLDNVLNGVVCDVRVVSSIGDAPGQ